MTTQARAIDVANAAVTLLNSAGAQTSFGTQTFTAVRDYVPLYDLTQHKAGLIVTVMPSLLNESIFQRHTVQGLVVLDVGIQNYVKTLANKDALMLLVEQVKEVMEAGLTLPEANLDCGWQATENDPIYRPDHMQQHSVFTSVPQFTYLTRRAR